MTTSTLANAIRTASRTINNRRTVQDVLTHAVTEIGELALEVQISQGRSYKQHGDDGIVGEALDVIACMVDMIYVHSPFMTEDEMVAMISPKLAKWQEKAQEIQTKK